jgi:D-alanyl-D-alanine carboxypeptidase
MSQFIPHDLRAARRMGTHALALGLVLGIALAGVSSAAAPVSDLRISSVTSQTSSVLPGQVVLDFVAATPVPTAVAGGVRTQGADQRGGTAPAAFDPSLGMPLWLRTIHDAPLWSGSDSSATSSGSLPAGSSYVKPLGPVLDNRGQVYFPGDAEQRATQAWIDTSTVVPSGVPPWVAPAQSQTPASDDQTTAVVTTSPSPSSLLPPPPQRAGDAPAPDTTAVHIAIVDDDSGQLIYGEQPNTEVPQASTTKIATTIVALERSPDLSKRIKVTISASAMVARDGSSTMGIEPGRSVSLDTLLHGMMLPSGNDAAEQVAVALADTREQYVDWMNQEAAALGLKDTHFINPSGMDAAGHYSSAYDMAMLARYAMHNATFRDLAGTSQYTSDGFPMSNLNRLLNLYPGADGVKIGYTDAALKTIVASATRDGHRVFVSLMRSQDLVGDSTALFNWVWDQFTW